MNFKEQVVETNKVEFSNVEGFPEEIAKEEIAQESGIPTEYIAVTLSSKGKFNAPKVIHIRNYVSSDLLDLSALDDEHTIEATLKALKSVIYEDIDVSQLTEIETREIFLTLYSNWWGSVLPEHRFPINEADITYMKENSPELLDRIIQNKIALTVDIPVENLNIKPIDDVFKEPITITNRSTGAEVGFRTSRIGDGILAKKYINSLYAEEDRKYRNLKIKMQREQSFGVEDKSITEEQRENYNDYHQRRSLDLVKALQACLIVSYNGKTDLTFEEKMIICKETLDSTLWFSFNKTLNDYTYGLSSEVEVISPVTHKPEIRRFQFRSLDFIPSSESTKSSEYDIRFG